MNERIDPDPSQVSDVSRSLALTTRKTIPSSRVPALFGVCEESGWPAYLAGREYRALDLGTP